MNFRMAKRLQLTTATRGLCGRLYNERRNPEHLQANLDRVVDLAMRNMQDRGIGTTRDSVVITLGYLARGDDPAGELGQSIVDAINER